ncbi:MAG: tyrosine-type recombinase/integrase, partial [Candidatus Bathyarchaeota archaeon]
MKNNGLSDHSIKAVGKALRLIAEHTDIDNPDQVKQFIARREVSNGTKRNYIRAYEHYVKFHNIQWQKPIYHDIAKPIRIPTRERLHKIISGAGNTLSTKLQLSMETGLRPVELCNLKVKDADLEQRIIYPTTAKYGASRQLRISQSLAKRLGDHIQKRHLKPDDNLFTGDLDYYGKMYRNLRNRLAEKLQDATLKTIRLYDFRHYFATALYDKTKDILLVKQQMGHKKLDTTL